VAGLALHGSSSSRFVQTLIFRRWMLFCWHKTDLHGELSQRPVDNAVDDDDDDDDDDDSDGGSSFKRRK